MAGVRSASQNKLDKKRFHGKSQMSVANVAPGSASTLSVFSVGSGGSGGNYTWDNKSLTAGTTQIQSTLRVDGDADFNGDIRVQGQSITEAITKINERLNILVPNEKLEADWSELAELRIQYVELEQRLLEKQKVFDILKKSD
jgi:hypothetical protein